jgi:hypothetical protein
MERLREELRETLSALGEINECAEEFIEQAPRLNATPHEEPSRYFDDDLASLVAERDGELIKRYGYTL